LHKIEDNKKMTKKELEDWKKEAWGKIF